MATIFGLTRSLQRQTPFGSIDSLLPGGIYINTVIPLAPHVDPSVINDQIPVSQSIVRGRMICDGTPRKPELNITGNLPQLRDERLLGADVSAGNQGGARNISLAESNLPVHSHTNELTSSDAPHSHPSTASNVNSPHFHSSPSIAAANAPHNHFQAVVAFSSPGSTGWRDYRTTAFAGQFNQDASALSNNVTHSHASNATSNTSIAHSHNAPLSGSSLLHTHTINALSNAGGLDPVNIEPEAMTVVYLIRVK